MKRSRSQGGYILGTVLAAMVIGLTIITALLGLSFATHRAAITQQDLAQERRAADGALETSVDLMRNADLSDPCDVVPGTVKMDTPNGVNEVAVNCTSILDARPSVSGAVTVIGQEEYKGGQLWGSGDPTDSSDIHLIHQGGEPVSFVGDVNVRTGAAVSGSADVGAEVSGNYQQGDDGTNSASLGHPCGLLSASAGQDPKRVLRDAEGEPACGVDDIKNIPRGRPSVPVVDTDDKATVPPVSACSAAKVELQPGYYGNVETHALNVLMASPSCGDKTFHFTPGYYWFDAHPDDGFALNFPDAGSNYAFGELDGTGKSCDPNAAGPTSATSVILGAYSTLKHTGGNLTICAGTGNDPVSFPALAKSGTAAVVGPTLNAPTSRFADNPNGNEGRFVNPGVATEPRPADANDRARADLCKGSTLIPPPLGPSHCPNVGLVAEVNSTGSRKIESLKVRWDSWEKPPTFFATRQVSARILRPTQNTSVCNTGNTLRGRVNGLGLELDLKNCVKSASNPTGFFEKENELNGYRLELTFSTNSLFGSADPPGCFPGGECPYRMEVWNLELAVNEVEIKATSATSAGSPEPDWKAANPASAEFTEALTESGGAYVAAEDGCAYPIVIFGVSYPGADVCDRPYGPGVPAPTPKEFTISGFGGEPWPTNWTDDTNISSARLSMDNAVGPPVMAGTSDLVANATFDHPPFLDLGETRLSVTNADEPSDPPCLADSQQGYTRSTRTYSISLDQCATQITTARALARAELNFAITPERHMFMDIYREGPGVELPQIDYARVIAQTGDWEQVDTMLFTIDESVGNRVRVYGDSELQLADVDIHWTGKASPFESIFNGNLKVNALSSLGNPGAEVGVVCCGFKYPNVLLTAQILDNPPDPDGPIRGVAQVFLDPSPFGPPHIAQIADWELCHLDGCEVDPVAAGT